MSKLTRVSPQFENIWELIDFLLDCIEYPEPGVFIDLSTVDGINLREYTKKEYNKLIKQE